MDSRDWLASILKQDRLNRLAGDRRTEQLPPFQQHAVLRAVDLLRRRGGCLLADEVGLGKTHIAAAAMRTFAGAHSSVLVIAPASLLQMWRTVVGPAPGVVFLSYTSLVRRGAAAPPGGWDLVVVDEAHRLRNRTTKRFKRVSDLSARVPLLLITATPMHNRLADVVSLLNLLTGSLRLDTLERLRACLVGFIIRRTRPIIDAFYGLKSDHSMHGLGPRARIHSPCPPLSAPVRDLLADWSHLQEAAFPEQPPEVLRLVDRMLLKRAESSPVALFKTIERSLLFLERAEEAARVGRGLRRPDFKRLFGADPLWTAAQQVFPFFYDGLESEPVLQFERLGAQLAELLERARSGFSPEADPKLAYLLRLLETDAGRVRVIVSCFRDTADYVHRHLRDKRSVMVCGAEARAASGARLSRREALLRFSPNSHTAHVPSAHRFFTLVATDTISEGVNLQDADQLVHYDTPWNPITVRQREGRLVRLGSRHDSIDVIRFGVPEELERRLAITTQLNSKRAAALRLISDERPIDRPALTMAAYHRCCSPLRLGGSAVETSERVWFVALIQDESVTIVECGADAVRESTARHLHRLAAGVPVCWAPDSPPRAVLRRAVEFLRRLAATRRWTLLEPRAVRIASDRPRRAHLPHQKYRIGQVSPCAVRTADEPPPIRLLGAIGMGPGSCTSARCDRCQKTQPDSPLARIRQSR